MLGYSGARSSIGLPQYIMAAVGGKRLHEVYQELCVIIILIITIIKSVLSTCECSCKDVCINVLCESADGASRLLKLHRACQTDFVFAQ